MKRIVVGATIVFAMLIVGLVLTTKASADVDEGSISASVQSLAGETNWGADLAIPFDAGSLGGHLTVHADGGGGIIRGKYHFEFGKTVNGTDIVIFQDGVFKGYNIRDLGRQSDLGAAIELPEKDVGGFHLNIAVGIFGRNAGAFGPPSAYDVLEAANFNLNELDMYPILTELTPAPTTLSIKGDNSVNVLVSTEGKNDSGDLRWKLRLMPELAGAGDNTVHQAVLNIDYKRAIAGSWNADIGIDIAAQTWDDEIQREYGFRGGVSRSFDL